MQPYRREEPRATMTNTTDEKVDATDLSADEAVDRTVSEARDYEPDLDVILKAVLFHPNLSTMVKILLMQLVWIGSPLNADDLGKGTGLTPLSILHQLKPMIELGAVRARFVMVDESSGQTVRVFEVPSGLLGKLARVEPAAAEKDDA